jgi:hypothetical protein
MKGNILGSLLAAALAFFAPYTAFVSGRNSYVADAHPAQDTQTEFQWITQPQDPVLWAKVQAAFRQELLPDRRTAHGVAHEYKYILRIGAYRDSRLVLIGQRTKRDDPPEFDLFRAFTYDVGTSRKSRVGPSGGFWYWRLVTLAQVDRSPVPDVFFTHDDCIECEAKHRLSSFSYSAKDKKWKLRSWPPDGTDLLIGGASKDEPQEIYEYVCLYAIHDFNGDKLKDIAIWCRKRATVHGGENDTAALYTTQGRRPRRIAPTNTLLASIKKELCGRTPGSPLCASTR